MTFLESTTEKLKQASIPAYNQLKTIYGKSGLDAQVEPYRKRFEAMPVSQQELAAKGSILAVFALCVVFILSPTFQALIHNGLEISRMKSEVISSKSDIANIALTRDAAIKATASIATLHARILEEDDRARFLDHLSKMAQESGINIKSVAALQLARYREILPRSLPKGYILAGFEIKADGGYHELGDFVQRLENYETFVQVQGIEIYHSKRQSGERKHEVTIKIQMLQKGA